MHNAVKSVSLTVLSISTALTACGAGHTGLALIGLGAYATPDIDLIAKDIAAAEAAIDKRVDEVEVAFLFASFNPADPWGAATRLVQKTLPQLRGKLTLTVYLDDGPNRLAKSRGAIPYGPYFRPDLTPLEFWQLAGGYSSNTHVRQFYSDWNTKLVSPYLAGAQRLLQWAHDHRCDGKLQLIVVPVLEDNTSNALAYQNLLKTTQAGLRKLPVTYRRNGALRMPGLPLEQHGLSSKGLRQGDLLSNDGCPHITVNQWVSLERNDVSVSYLFWDQSYNGANRSIPPSKRGPLHPVTGPSSFFDPNRVIYDVLTRTFDIWDTPITPW